LLETVITRLDTIITQNNDLIALQRSEAERETAMAIDLSELVTEVEETKGTAASAVVLINGLSDKVDELIAGSNDPVVQAQLTELKTALAASRGELANAVATNPVP
jgi:rubrerythrin